MPVLSIARLLAAAALVTASLALGAGPALGSFASCTYDSGSRTVTAVTSPSTLEDMNTLAVSGGTILANGSPCLYLDGPSATVLNTDLIVVDASAVSDTVVFDLSGGPFAPGATPESGFLNVSDIEILITGTNTPGSSTDYRNSAQWIIVRGGSGADWVTAGDGSGGVPQDFGGWPGPDGDVPILNLNAQFDQDGDVFLDLDAAPGFEHAIDGDASKMAPGLLTLEGNGGDDVLTGSDGDGTGGAVGPGGLPVAYNEEALHLSGGDGDDTLEGGTGDDFLRGDLGSDVIDGRSDTGDFDCDVTSDPNQLFWNTGDTVSYGNGPGPVQVNLGALPFGVGLATGAQGDDELFNVEAVVGSPGNDLLKGDRKRNIIVGWEGDDVVFGGLGNDCLAGQAGADDVIGWFGNDIVHGGDGNDAVHGNLGNDQVFGGHGGDALHGDFGNDQLFADDDEFDTVNGGAGSDSADVDKLGDGSPAVDTVNLVETIF